MRMRQIRKVINKNVKRDKNLKRLQILWGAEIDVDEKSFEMKCNAYVSVVIKGKKKIMKVAKTVAKKFEV